MGLWGGLFEKEDLLAKRDLQLCLPEEMSDGAIDGVFLVIAKHLTSFFFNQIWSKYLRTCCHATDMYGNRQQKSFVTRG
jgi:hypothetical protein